MPLAPSDRLAQRLALGVPALLLAGAYVGQYGFGLYPCEMCWWQRYAHMAALPFAALALMAGPDRVRALVLAALAIAVSGAIGFYHAGVELDYFEGFTQCTSGAAGGSAADLLRDVFARPLVRCDDIQWSFLGVSMAGWNAILSLSAALLILWLSLSKRRPA